LTGDCRDVLPTLPEHSVNCVITSPPYFGLRDYGVDGQIGQEPSPAEFVEALVGVFREVRRVLRDDGTVWLNLGDSYAASGMGGNPAESAHRKQATNHGSLISGRKAPEGMKPKDMIGIPWRVAFALQADGWYLRSDIIWSKPNPMPESVTDRPTKSHEYIFLISKSQRYFYDSEAIKEPMAESSGPRLQAALEGDERHIEGKHKNAEGSRGKPMDTMRRLADKHAAALKQDALGKNTYTGFNERYSHSPVLLRNKRTVWTVPTSPYSGAHFATFPPDLIRPCVLAGCPIDGTVLDPFGGAGTTGLVADREQRNAILIELNPEYASLAQERIQQDATMFAQVSA
jgi:DNA modification methylase